MTVAVGLVSKVAVIAPLYIDWDAVTTLVRSIDRELGSEELEISIVLISDGSAVLSSILNPGKYPAESSICWITGGAWVGCCRTGITPGYS